VNDADKMWLLAGLVAGLALCSIVDAIEIARLRADVDFLTVVAEKAIGVSSG